MPHVAMVSANAMLTDAGGGGGLGGVGVVPPPPAWKTPYGAPTDLPFCDMITRSVGFSGRLADWMTLLPVEGGLGGVGAAIG